MIEERNCTVNYDTGTISCPPELQTSVFDWLGSNPSIVLGLLVAAFVLAIIGVNKWLNA